MSNHIKGLCVSHLMLHILRKCFYAIFKLYFFYVPTTTESIITDEIHRVGNDN